eukprot:jgi/Bigna1/80845/fgenesh1_pg.75_\
MEMMIWALVVALESLLLTVVERTQKQFDTREVNSTPRTAGSIKQWGSSDQHACILCVLRGASIGQGEEVNNSSINLFKVLLKTEFLTSLRDDRVSKEALLDEVSDFILRKGKLVTALLVSNWAKEMEKAQLARKRSGNGYGASSVVGRTPLAKRRSVDNAAFFPSYDRKRGLDSGGSATGGPSDVPLDAFEIQRTKAGKPADRRSDEILGHQDKPNSTDALSPPAIANSPPEKGEGGAAFSFRTSTKQASIIQLSEEERREAIV